MFVWSQHDGGNVDKELSNHVPLNCYVYPNPIFGIDQQQYQYFSVWVLCTSWIGMWGGGTGFIA